MILGLALAAGVAGAATEPPASRAAEHAASTAAARADAIRAAARRLPSVKGRRHDPAGDTSWRASFDGDELAMIEESVPDGPRPALRNRYFFEHGVLFYFSGEQAAATASGAQGPAPRVPVVAEFQGARAVSAVRIEHYGEVPLEPARVAAIRELAAELANAARGARTAPKAAP
jgi:hypothetical protein